MNMKYEDGSPNSLIDKELSRYSWKEIREFESLFPCKNPLTTIEVGNKEYGFEKAFIAEQRKRNNEQEFIEKYAPENIKYESPEEFWARWNRFLKIKRFSF